VSIVSPVIRIYEEWIENLTKQWLDNVHE